MHFHISCVCVQQNHSVKLVLTCRDYSAETVRNSLLAPLGLQLSVHNVPELSDKELQSVQGEVPSLNLPLQDSHLQSFLRTPYVLDLASRLDWEEGTRLENARAFRDKCWKELVRANQFTADSMPNRREEVFISVAYQRAKELQPFVRLESPDVQAQDALVQASLIVSSPQSTTHFGPSA